MKVMISQPMNGRHDAEIRNERDEVIKKLQSMHIDVIDTFFEDNVVNHPRADIYLLSKSILKMCEADAIIFIGDWRNARGCYIEHEVAKRYGIKILYSDFIEPTYSTTTLERGVDFGTDGDSSSSITIATNGDGLISGSPLNNITY